MTRVAVPRRLKFEVGSGGSPLASLPLLPHDVVSLRVGAAAEVTFAWGRADGIGTAAYWVDQALTRPEVIDNRLGNNIYEEIVACLLGGYGVSAETGMRAFQELRARGLVRLHPAPSESIVERALAAARYRFPRQRGHRIAVALRRIAAGVPPLEPQELRTWLLRFPGIGPKTASWIVRNQTGYDRVGVIDIHVRRAGNAAGFFLPSWTLPRDYGLFEATFLAVADLGGVSASRLDSIMWTQMRTMGRWAVDTLGPPA